MERIIEKGLFASRWLMAPFYVGLVGALLILLYTFVIELVHTFAHLSELTPDKAVLGILSLIDLSLAGNLLLIVIFSGYENFVSKFNFTDHEDRPEWQGTVDFSALKLKLVASIVAISGIHLLKVFMNVRDIADREIQWMVVIHLVFIFSGVMLALMDKISVSAKSYKTHGKQ
ncbi:MAG: TIGR00645 family protein [Alphaproteobacteria bacterium]